MNIELPLLKAKTGVVTPNKRLTVRADSLLRRLSGGNEMVQQPVVVEN